MAQGLHDRFDRGGVYTCTSCGHRTRRVGDETDTCNNCYEMGGLENLFADTGDLSENDRLMYVQMYHIFCQRRKAAGLPFAKSPIPEMNK